MKRTTAFCTISLGIFLLMYLSSPLSADVLVERNIKTGGVAAAEVHEIDFIKGAMKRTDSKMKFTGKVIGMLTKPKDHSTIYLVGRDLVWEVNHAKKTYSERTISLPQEEKGDLEDMGEGSEDMNTEGEREKDEVRIVRNEFSVKETGEKKKINGFDCRQYLMTWLVETENVRTKERNKNIMTGDFWNAPEEGAVLQLMEEENSFSRAYLQKLGLQITPGEMKKFGLEVLGGLLSAAGPELKKEMEKLKGYPIVSSIKWEAEREMEEEAEDEEAETVDTSKGVKGFLGGLLKKRIAKKEKKEGDLELLFESYTEIERIDTSPLPDTHFEVPKEYKKEASVL